MLNDKQIRAWCESDPPMISPFVGELVRSDPSRTREKILSFGLSSAGYDIRLAPGIKRVSKLTQVLDPLSHDDRNWYVDNSTDTIILEPGEFVLGRSVEYFQMPPNIVGIAYPKSTYLRVGLHVPISPLEPGWKGHLVMELRNSSSARVVVYLNQGIAQVTFFKIATPETSYADRNGKYQGQTGVTHAR